MSVVGIFNHFPLRVLSHQFEVWIFCSPKTERVLTPASTAHCISFKKRTRACLECILSPFTASWQSKFDTALGFLVIWKSAVTVMGAAQRRRRHSKCQRVSEEWQNIQVWHVCLDLAHTWQGQTCTNKNNPCSKNKKIESHQLVWKDKTALARKAFYRLNICSVCRWRTVLHETVSTLTWQIFWEHMCFGQTYKCMRAQKPNHSNMFFCHSKLMMKSSFSLVLSLDMIKWSIITAVPILARGWGWVVGGAERTDSIDWFIAQKTQWKWGVRAGIHSWDIQNRKLAGCLPQQHDWDFWEDDSVSFS